MTVYYSNNPRPRDKINTPPYIVISCNKPRIILGSFSISRIQSCKTTPVFLGTAYLELVCDYLYSSQKQNRSSFCYSIEHAFPEGLHKTSNAAMSTQPCSPDPYIPLASLPDQSNFPEQNTFSKLPNKISDLL